MLKVPHLRTERLTLEPFSMKHSPGMFELWTCPEVSRYSGPVIDFQGNSVEMPTSTHQESDKILDFFIRHQAEGTAFRWAVLVNDGFNFAGAVGFNSLGRCSEIAYHLHPRYWGKGIMSEACRAAISWVRSTFGSTLIDAYIEAENLASITLVRKLQFAPTGETKDGATRYLLDARNT